MKRYKIQAAYGERIYSPASHNEAKAAQEVSYLLGTWLRRNWEQIISIEIDEAHNHPEFMNSLVYLLANVPQLIAQGKVWDAYDLYEDFYVRFEHEFGYPLYVKMGTVIVEGSKKTGLKNRVPLLEEMDVSPMEKYSGQGKKGPMVTVNRRENLKTELLTKLIEEIARKANEQRLAISMEEVLMIAIMTEQEIDGSGKYDYQDEATEAAYLAALRRGILKRIFPNEGELFPKGGKSLGALTSWMVQYGDFGGAWHGGHHTSESRAKLQAKEYLEYLIRHLKVHADTEAHVKRNREYVKEARDLMQHLRTLIDKDLIWTAYLDFKAFEEQWNQEFSPFPLNMAIGSMRVIPTPEAEECHGTAC